MTKATAKRLLLTRVFELRRNQFTYESLDKPQSVQDDMIEVDGQQVKRRRVVLTAHGCKVATCSMCPLPDEAVDAKTAVTLEHWMAQIKDAIGPNDDVHTLTLFHNGNWFNDAEVPSAWRMHIGSYLSTTHIKHLVVESLPQYVTVSRVASAKTDLKHVKLIVAIGLQSSNELVRELCILTTCMEGSFERAIQTLRAWDFDTQVFLMFGAAFLNEYEAAHDLQSSIDYCQSLGITPTICPLQVAPNTLVADLVARGLYEPPRSAHLFDVLQAIHGRVRIAVSLFKPDDPWRKAFDAYNREGHPSPMPHRLFLMAWPDETKVLARIEEYLRAISVDTGRQVG